MEKWRFIDVDWLTYAETASYRQALMKAKSESLIPDTMSFCTFKKPSVIVPYFSDPEKEINLGFCRERGIHTGRVVLGGGPVFGGTGYIIVFLHIARNNPKVPPNSEKMFEKVLTGVATGISEFFNVECRFRPINDVEIKCEDSMWRKIGPSGCLYQEKAVQMTSGVQVKENDINLIESIIAAPKEKFLDKQAKNIKERITYLEKVVGRNIDLEELKKCYISLIEKIFKVTLVPGELTENEKRYIKEMEKEYTSDEFFMERSERRFGTIPSDVIRKTVQFKVSDGPFIRIITYIKNDRIWNILISGTIHASPLRPKSPIHEIEEALKGQPIDEKLFELKIEEILNRPNFDIAKTSPELLAIKIYECATQ